MREPAPTAGRRSVSGSPLFASNRATSLGFPSRSRTIFGSPASACRTKAFSRSLHHDARRPARRHDSCNKGQTPFRPTTRTTRNVPGSFHDRTETASRIDESRYLCRANGDARFEAAPSLFARLAETLRKAYLQDRERRRFIRFGAAQIRTTTDRAGFRAFAPVRWAQCTAAMLRRRRDTHAR